VETGGGKNKILCGYIEEVVEEDYEEDNGDFNNNNDREIKHGY
jgi:hypothetical protein